MRPAFAKGFWLGSALAGGAYVSFGKMPPKDQTLERDAEHDLITTDRAKFYPVADGKLTFDKLSSVFASGNKTRDDQPSHIRIETRVPRDVAQMWSRLCPAHVYEVGEEDAGKVVVHVTPSNCVQCGAITAKGGRLTPPEGGSGPEYTAHLTSHASPQPVSAAGRALIFTQALRPHLTAGRSCEHVPPPLRPARRRSSSP